MTHEHNSLTIKKLDIPGYQTVIEGEDPSCNLHCLIAIHNTTLGPALGGARIRDYKNREDALSDVLNLSKAMSYKSAIAENGLGGGKSVLMGNPKNKTEAMLLAFGKVIDSLQGQYIVAEDVGTTLHDMEIIRKSTRYVAALAAAKSSGDPSRYTAWGVYRGIEAVTKTLWGTRDLHHRTIAIQGLGSVGEKLADILFWEGADLILSEIDEEKLHRLAILYGAKTVPVDKFYKVDCDILAPCAFGEIVNDSTIKKLRCKAIAGSANNQLHHTKDGQKLLDMGILYAPDYVINAGGIINAATEFDPEGYIPKNARDRVNHIYDVLLNIFEKSERTKTPTNIITDEIAESNIVNKVNIRKNPINWPKR